MANIALPFSHIILKWQLLPYSFASVFLLLFYTLFSWLNPTDPTLSYDLPFSTLLPPIFQLDQHVLVIALIFGSQFFFSRMAFLSCCSLFHNNWVITNAPIILLSWWAYFLQYCHSSAQRLQLHLPIWSSLAISFLLSFELVICLSSLVHSIFPNVFFLFYFNVIAIDQ